MTALRERDAMWCRSCGHEERASEGYPCATCGTFVCLMCVFRGVVRCATCEGGVTATGDFAAPARMAETQKPFEWPEH